MAQLHVRLPDETKAEWEGYADEHGYGSLSRLVRVAVANERSRGGGDPQLETDSVEVSLPDRVAMSNDVDQVHDTLLKLTTRIDELSEQVEQAERGVVTPSDPRAVFEALPRERPTLGAEGRNYEVESSLGQDVPNWEVPNTGTALDGTAESVAKVTGETVVSMEHLLATTAHESEDVHADTIGGEIRYWVEIDE